MRTYSMTTWMISGLAGLALFPAIAFAEDGISKDDQAALLTPVKRYVVSFNKGDATLPGRIFAPNAITIDGATPPYLWPGQGQPGDYYNSMIGATPEAHAKVMALKGHIALKQPRFARITGDAAYLVLPTIYSYVDDGKPHRQDALWTFTETKTKEGWLITSNTWTITHDE